MNFKKGTTEKTVLTTIIIFVVVALVFFKVLTSMNSTILTFSNVEKCRTTIAAASKSASSTGIQFSKIDCPRKYVEIGDEVLIDENIDDNYLFYTVAEELRECWYKMGEGKLEPFSKKFLSDSVPCIVCSKISFSDDLKGKKVEGFMNYLETKKIDDTGITYFNYLSNDVTIPFLWWDTYTKKTLRNDNDKLNLDDDYYVIYKQFNPDTISRWSDVVGEFVFGDYSFDEAISISSLNLIEASEFNVLMCEQIYN